MKTVKVSNETSMNLYVKVVAEMNTVEVKSRTSKFVQVDELKEIDTFTVTIKE